MPTDGKGWRVCLLTSACGCLINFKEGTCVHVLVAKMDRRIAFSGWTPPSQMLVNQRIIRAATRANNRFARISQGNHRGGRGRRGIRTVGRQPTIGTALQMQ